MEFDRGMTQQMREVHESFGVLQTIEFATVANGPKLALFVENRLLGQGRTLKHGRRGGFHAVTILCLRFHLIAPSPCKASCVAGTTVREFLGLLTHRCRESLCSLCAKRRIQSVDQSLFAKRLVQEADRSRLKRLLSCLCVPEVRDEDDWNGMRRNQMPLQ